MGLFDRLIGGIPTSTAIASGDLPGTIASNTTGTAANITGTSNATLTTLSALTTASALSSIGTITTGVWNGTTIAIANGGTGQTSAASAFNALNPMTTTGDLIYESATGVASRLGIGSTNQVLTVVGGVPTWASGGSGTVTSVALTVPTFLSVSGSPITTSGTLAVSLSGTALPIANGGTGVTSATTTPTASAFAAWDANKNLSTNSSIPALTSTVTSASAVTLTVSSTQNQVFTGSTAQTVNLPVAATLANGQSFTITNLATTVTTVQTSGATVMQAMATNTQLIATVQNTGGGTGLASWTWTYTSAQTAAAGKLAILVGGTGVTAVTTAPTATTFAGWDANKNLSANSVIEGFTTTATAAGTTTLVVGSTQQQFFTGTNTQTVKLPTTTIVAGQSFTIVNLSTGNVTVQSSNASNIQVMTQNTQLVVTALVATPTTAANWNAFYAPLVASGGGSVTSVALSDGSTTPIYSISGSPVTTSGTLTFTLATQSANTVFAGPNGSSGQPTFRSLVAADIPTISLTTGVSGTLQAAQFPALTGDVTTTAGALATSLVATSNATLTSLSALTSASSLATVGTIATGVWNGTAITPAFGGTGLTTLTAYAILAGGTTSTGTLQQVSGLGTSGQVLTSNGASALPTWQAVAASGYTIVSTSTAVTAVARQYILCTGSTNFAVTLPTAVGISGQSIVVMHNGTNFTQFQILTTSAQTIGNNNGSPDGHYDLYTAGETVTLVSDNANWQVQDHFCNVNRPFYTPTFVGLGTCTSLNCYWWRDGTDIILAGSFVAGTPTATTASMSLPGGMISTSAMAPTELVGDVVRSSGASTTFFRDTVLCGAGGTVVNFGVQSSTTLGANAATGTGFCSAGDTITYRARITISKWQP